MIRKNKNGGRTAVRWGFWGTINSFLSDSNNIYTVISIAVGIGFLVASFYVVLNKAVCGNFARRLISRGATAPTNALTLSAVGYKNKWQRVFVLPFIRAALGKNGFLRKIVIEADDNLIIESRGTDGIFAVPIPYKKRNFARDRFFVPKPFLDRAEVMFRRRGNGVAGLVIMLTICALLSVTVIFLLPKILELFDFLFETAAGGAL